MIQFKQLLKKEVWEKEVWDQVLEQVNSNIIATIDINFTYDLLFIRFDLVDDMFLEMIRRNISTIVMERETMINESINERLGRYKSYRSE